MTKKWSSESVGVLEIFFFKGSKFGPRNFLFLPSPQTQRQVSAHGCISSTCIVLFDYYVMQFSVTINWTESIIWFCKEPRHLIVVLILSILYKTCRCMTFRLVPDCILNCSHRCNCRCCCCKDESIQMFALHTRQYLNMKLITLLKSLGTLLLQCMNRVSIK